MSNGYRCSRAERAFNTAKVGARGLIIIANANDTNYIADVDSQDTSAAVETLQFLEHVHMPIGVMNHVQGVPLRPCATPTCMHGPLFRRHILEAVGARRAGVCSSGASACMSAGAGGACMGCLFSLLARGIVCCYTASGSLHTALGVAVGAGMHACRERGGRALRRGHGQSWRQPPACGTPCADRCAGHKLKTYVREAEKANSVPRLKMDFTHEEKGERVVVNVWHDTDDDCGVLCHDVHVFIADLTALVQQLDENSPISIVPRYLYQTCVGDAVSTDRCKRGCVNNGK